MRNTYAVLLLAGFLYLPSFAQVHGGPHPPPPPRAVVPETGTTVPMLDFGGRPVVSLMIGGHGPYRFILDTGAGITVVADDLARELALGPPPGMQVMSASGSPAPTIVIVPAASIADTRLEGITAIAAPLQAMFKEPDAPRGVLSAGSFPGYLLKLDYPNKRVSIKKGALGQADSKTIFEYGQDDQLPTVPIRIAGHDWRVHVDSGSAYGLTLPTHFLKELPLSSEPVETGKARTPGGEFPISRATVAGDLELGSYKIHLDQVAFSDVRPGPAPGIGNIGYEVLHGFVVTFDSQNRRIKFDQ
ncbi:MAG TPA: retroviral-like aspartic protease family protein [Candidatus Angelobacter sp.]